LFFSLSRLISCYESTSLGPIHFFLFTVCGQHQHGNLLELLLTYLVVINGHWREVM